MFKKLGCHLYPWNPVLNEKGIFSSEIQTVFSWIKEQGFSGIETGARFIPNGREEEVKNLLQSNQLVITGIHMGAAIFDEKGVSNFDELISEIKRVKATGTEFIVLSGMKKENITKVEATLAAKMLNQIGEACKREELKLVYHNHDYEFVNNQMVQTILIEETNPEYVSFALDLGWVYYTGTDLNQFFEEHFNRISYLHYRDVVQNKFIELGSGEVDFSSFVSLTRKQGFSGWNIVEMELGDSYIGKSELAEEIVSASVGYLKKLS